MAGFDKVSAGDPLRISASVWNGLLDSHLATQRNKLGDSVTHERAFYQSGIVLARNDSAADLIRFGVAGVEDMVVTPDEHLVEFENRPAFALRAPEAGDENSFVISHEPIGVGRIGRVTAHGITPVDVDVSDSGHSFAVAEVGTVNNLVSAAAGSARILWREGGTGLQKAVVRISNHAASGSPVVAICADLVDYTPALEVATPTEIRVNKSTSLRIWSETAEPSVALIDIGGGPTDSVFHQSAGGGSPQWHRSPSVGRSVQIGGASFEGFLHLDGPDTPGVWHLPPPSGGEQKIRWPTTVPPGINSFLYVNARDDDGKCLQTEWVGQGCDFEGYASFGYDCGTLDCHYVLIRRGLVIQVGDLSVQPPVGDSGTVDCEVTPLDPYDPCDEPGPNDIEFADGTGDFLFMDGTQFEFVG